MKVVLSTTHLGSIGGGENYLMRLAMALDGLCDFSVLQNWPTNFKENNGFYKSFKQYDGLYQPDIFIHCSHFYLCPVLGKRNFVVSFFPKESLKPKDGVWDGCISITNYTAKYALSYWGLDSTVIYPCINPEFYTCGEKDGKRIVSIGHFFEEPDGHSKNQHILVEAFTRTLEDAGYELVLIGNANAGDERYLRKVRDAAKGKNVRIEVNKDFAFVKSELAKAKYLWSANGFGRKDPAQTEHFGLIFLEALASGVVPFAFKAGGYAEIDGVVGWEKSSELAELTLRDYPTPSLPKQFTIDVFDKKVEEWLSKVSK